MAATGPLTQGKLRRYRRQAAVAVPRAAYRAGEEVFSINFVRPHPLKACAQRILPRALLVYVTINVAVGFALVVTTCSLWYRYHTLPTASLSALPRETAELQQQVAQSLVELNTAIVVQRQRFPVAGKLAAMANTLPPRTWITGIKGKREGRTIKIQALSVIDPEKPYQLPAKGWIDGLRADPVFGRQLKRLLLGASSRESRGKVELFRFELLAEWSQ